EGLDQGDLTFADGPHLLPINDDHSQEFVRPQHRDGQHSPHGVYLLHPVRVLWVALNIVNVDGASLEGSTRRGAPAAGGHRILLHEGSRLGGGIVGGDESQHLAVEAEDERAFGLAQSHRVFGQRLEDRLEVERGPADHLEQLAGRRLLLERDSQFAVARLQLLEETDVFDSDHGLVGEGLEEADLLVGERAHLESPDEDRSDGRLLAQQGHGHDGPDARAPYAGLNLWGLPIELLQDVFDVHRSLLEHRTPGYGLQGNVSADCRTTSNRAPQAYVVERPIFELVE